MKLKDLLRLLRTSAKMKIVIPNVSKDGDYLVFEGAKADCRYYQIESFLEDEVIKAYLERGGDQTIEIEGEI